MKSFRNPKYIERYEYVIFDLETPLNKIVGNNAHKLVAAIVGKSMKQKIFCVKQRLQSFDVIKSKMAASGKLRNGNRRS